MLINRLFPINTQLTRLKEIPDTFFAKLEDAKAFDSSLFPIWLTDARGRPTVFGSRTDLREKFKAIYDKYKDIVNVAERRKVIVAYFETNKIIDLCNFQVRHLLFCRNLI